MHNPHQYLRMARYSSKSASSSDEVLLKDEMEVPHAYSGRVAPARSCQWAQHAVFLVLCVMCVVQAVLLRHSQPENRPHVYCE